MVKRLSLNMRYASLSIFFILLLTACYSVKFEYPQPKTGSELTEIPSKIIGKYATPGGDYFTITKNTITVDNEKDTLILSDPNAVLKNLGSFYILSFREDNMSDWNVYPFQVTADSLIAYSMDVESEEAYHKLIKDLGELTFCEPILDEDGELRYYRLNPTKKEFKKLLKNNHFIKQETFVKIRN